MIFDSIHFQKKYWNIAKRLTLAELQKPDEDSNHLFEKDLFNVNIGGRGNELFLGFYSRAGLQQIFKKYGIFEEFRRKGFKSPKLTIDTSDPYVHKLLLHSGEKKRENMLVELVLKKEVTKIDMPFDCALKGRKFEALSIEWMAMQNPLGKFTEDRPRLPGQHYPGLGLASKAIELLIILAWRLKLCGLLNTPENYHNAYLYSKIFFYLNPEYQARLLAMKRDMEKYKLADVAWAIEWGFIKDVHTGLPLKWQPGKQIVPLKEELKKMFNSRTYRKYVNMRAKEYNYEFDIDHYKKRRDE